jgi:hypothetical protein
MSINSYELIFFFEAAQINSDMLHSQDPGEP